MPLNDNLYLILELEIDPPVMSESLIEARIEEKRRFWASKAQDAFKGPRYSYYLDNINTIRRDMLGPNNIREQLVAEALTIKYGELDNLLRLVAKNAEITESAIKTLASRKKIDESTVRKRAISNGYAIIQGSEGEYQKLYDQYFKGEHKSAVQFAACNHSLSALGVSNLYAFIIKYSNNPLQKEDILATWDVSRVRSLISEAQGRFKKMAATTEKGAGEQLCSRCNTIFKDTKSKKEYDEYLVSLKIKEILNNTILILGARNVPDKDFDRESINSLIEILGNSTLSKNIYVAVCMIENLPIDASTRGTSGDANDDKSRVCLFCNHVENVSDGRTVCSRCGKPLIVTCPKCGAKNSGGVHFCKCGFDLRNIGISAHRCAEAMSLAEAFNYDMAQKVLEEAKSLWSGNPEIAKCEKAISAQKAQIGDLAENLASELDSKRYYAAKRACEQIKKIMPNYQAAAITTQIESAISQADELISKAKSSPNKNDKIKNCLLAYDLCTDHPQIKILLADYPLFKPVNLKVAVDFDLRTNAISWGGDKNESGVYYTVVRKKNISPIHTNDGTVIGRVNALSVIDTKIESGASYYYAVFAEIAGVYSEPAVTAHPAVNTFEVRNAAATPLDGRARVSCEDIPSGAKMEIYSIDGNTQTLIAATTDTSFVIENLVNDVSHTLKVCLAYNVNGSMARTPGKNLVVLPTKPPTPIETLVVKRISETSFEAKWENPEREQVNLYYSDQKPSIKAGELLSVEELEKSFTKLSTKMTSDNSAVFTNESSGVIYLTAAIIKGSSAVCGNIARASKDESAQIVDVQQTNGNVNIYISPPKNAISFEVLYKFDCFASDISDTSATRLHITKREYAAIGALTIPNVEKRDYFISLFTAYSRDNEIDYSSAAEWLFKNSEKAIITYCVKQAAGLFGRGKVEIEFTTNSPNRKTPQIDLMYAIGNVPMFKNSAKLLMQIPACEGKSSFSVEIPSASIVTKDMYIKPFFTNAENESSFQLKIKSGSQLKIS